MNTVLVIALFACLAAMAAASGYGYQPGFYRRNHNIVTGYNNADRQQAVNHRAEYAGASSGTARYDGVPGTGNDFGYGYGYGGYGNGYGNDGYGNNNYGRDNYGYGNRRDGYGGH